MPSTHAYVIPCYQDEKGVLQVLFCKKRIFNLHGLKGKLSGKIDRFLKGDDTAKTLESWFKSPSLSGAINNRAGRLSIIGGKIERGSDSLATAKKELGEEACAKYDDSAFISLGSINSNRWGGDFYLLRLSAAEARDMRQKFGQENSSDLNTEIADIISIPLESLSLVHQRGYLGDEGKTISASAIRTELSNWFNNNRNFNKEVLVNKVCHKLKEPEHYNEDFSEIVNQIKKKMKSANTVDRNTQELARVTLSSPKTMVTESVVSNDKKTNKAPLPTKADGNCAFHAILGQQNSSSGAFEADDIAGKRIRLADAIRKSSSDSPLFPLIKTAIKELVWSNNTSMTGEAYQAVKKAQQDYEDHCLEREKLQEEWERAGDWNVFERKLNEYVSVLQHINDFRKSAVNASQEASLQDIFFTCLREDEGVLRGLILSIPELDQAYLDYKKSTENPVLDNFFADSKLLNEYADFILTPGQWLLPCELAMIAYVFDISIEYYPMSTVKPERINPGKLASVSVCFNGHNHYQRMATIVQDNSRAALVRNSNAMYGNRSNPGVVSDKKTRAEHRPKK